VGRALHVLGQHADALPYWDSAESTFDELGRLDGAEIRHERAALNCACAKPAGRGD
jgi:hypothetical protein